MMIIALDCSIVPTKKWPQWIKYQYPNTWIHLGSGSTISVRTTRSHCCEQILGQKFLVVPNKYSISVERGFSPKFYSEVLCTAYPFT